jgi:hypothetical protein
MEILIALLVVAAPWVVLAKLANQFAVDSRDTLPDDHRR